MEKNQATKDWEQHILDTLEHAINHADDEGLLVGEGHKRVAVTQDDIIWYEWLSGARRWNEVILDDEYLEAAFQAGRKDALDGN